MSSGGLCISLVGSCVLCVLLGDFLSSDDPWRDVRVVVATGPEVEPYSAGVNNTYYGYDGSGRLLVKESGPWVYFPASRLMRDGLAL